MKRINNKGEVNKKGQKRQGVGQGWNLGPFLFCLEIF